MASSESSSSAVATPEAAAQPLNLDVSIDKVSTCQRRVKVTIPREDIARYQDDALGELVPTALLPGFRPARAPRRLVGSKFKIFGRHFTVFI